MILMTSYQSYAESLTPSQISRSNSSTLAAFESGFFHGYLNRGVSLAVVRGKTDDQIGLSYGDSANEGAIDDIFVRRFGLSFRKYLGNSFNIRTDLSHFSLEDRQEWFRSNTLYKYQDIVYDFAIGNHWAFDSGLFLGADWIGFGGQLFALSDSFTASNEEAPPIAYTRKKNWKKARKNLYGTLLNFSIGILL